jgi:hypothetical protein
MVGPEYGSKNNSILVDITASLHYITATSWSPVQGVLPTVPDQETEETQPYAAKWE